MKVFSKQYSLVRQTVPRFFPLAANNGHKEKAGMLCNKTEMHIQLPNVSHYFENL